MMVLAEIEYARFSVRDGEVGVAGFSDAAQRVTVTVMSS
jgi:hypothetical protein